MKDIKLLVLDIDGTIAGTSNDVNETVKQAINKVQNKGIKVALATGRMYHSALRFHKSVNSQLPLVSYNGAWIQNPHNNQLYFHIPLPKEIARDLLKYYKQAEWSSQLEVHFYVNDQLYVETITAKTQDYCKRAGVNAIAVNDFNSLLKSDPTKVLVMCPDSNLIKKLSQNLQQHYQKEEVYFTQSTEIYLEAIHSSVNKGIAVKYLAEKILNLKAEEVMTIGDNFNDLTMLEYAGFSVAMGGAPKQLQEVADWVTLDVEEDGVAIAINEFLL
jgi:Cof subfamily protein (haloacid dehalogenase superfamily)